ncbi:MAG: hypothetical protein ACE5HF_11280 [Gemmatimonadota bacterium]
MRFLRGCLAVGLSVLAAGCMKFEYGIALEDDLSGTATLDMEIDFDRIARATAMMQHAMSGAEGPVTDEEVDAARERIVAQMESDEDLTDEGLSDKVSSDLPEGVTLVSASSASDELKHRVHIELAFDHVDRLRDLEMSDGGGPGGGEEEGEEPFAGLQITEDGDELVIRNQPMNPVENLEESPMMRADQLNEILEGFAVTFRLTTPFDVVETNATETDGNTLVWRFDLATLREGEGSTSIYARLKR